MVVLEKPVLVSSVAVTRAVVGAVLIVAFGVSGDTKGFFPGPPLRFGVTLAPGKRLSGKPSRFET